MGDLLNKGNEEFRDILSGRYVDKTGLITFINSTINKTPERYTCFTRPRRFGKSFAVQMLCAYYSKGCDSHELFDGLQVAKDPSYEMHINQYNVICLDMTGLITIAQYKNRNLLEYMQNLVINELREAFPEYVHEDDNYLPETLSRISTGIKERFILLIDEWDAVFREAKDDLQLQMDYVKLLRALFKDTTRSNRMIAAVYMTGILPIKKYNTQSAMSDFREYTVLDPDPLAEYVGFTEAEVEALCDTYDVNMEEMRNWYDGYSFLHAPHVYNPYSVMLAVSKRKFGNYWTMSETYVPLMEAITMNFDGLKDAVIAMLGGENVSVEVTQFQNDMTSFRNKDDVLTLLIHMGYLTYDEANHEAHIPNQEIAETFGDAVKESGWGEVAAAIRQSEDLLKATIRGDANAVAEALELVHESSSSVLRYNNEASLSSAIVIAYYTARRYYKIVQEFPQGRGFADMAFLPHPGVDKPAMIVELKYNQDADTAIRQIHENRYEGDLKKYYGNLLLVGINYDKEAKGVDAKHHTCVIEEVKHMAENQDRV